MTRHAAVTLLALVLLAIGTRACAVPAGGGTGGHNLYLPLAAQGAPRCNRWRGDDWWPCIEATLTAKARISSTPTATFRPWSSRTPTPRPMVARALAAVGGAGVVASAAPAGRGLWWTAGHAVPERAPWRLVVGGAPVVGWMRDPVRDLAQVRTAWLPDDGSRSPLAVLVPGDDLTLRPARGDVPAVFGEDVWAVHAGGEYQLYTRDFTPPAGAWLASVACVNPPAHVVWGDSGGGAFRVVDDGLGGVVVAAEEFASDGDVWCGVRQSVVIVRVP